MGTAVEGHSDAQQNNREEADKVSSLLAQEGGPKARAARRRTDGRVSDRRKLQELLEASFSVSKNTLRVNHQRSNLCIL